MTIATATYITEAVECFDTSYVSPAFVYTKTQQQIIGQYQTQ